MLPDDFGGFGRVAVLCMCEFAQLFPILATSLLRGSRAEKRREEQCLSRAVLVERIVTCVNIVVEKGRAFQTRAFGCSSCLQ